MSLLKRKRGWLALCAIILPLSACSSSYSRSEAQEILWEQFGNKPLDALFLAWGTPQAETTLTNGARLVKYSHSTVYGWQTSGQYERRCEASFLAEKPDFIISNIALEGDVQDCSQLARGQRGERRLPGAQVQPYFGYGYPYAGGRSGVAIGF